MRDESYFSLEESEGGFTDEDARVRLLFVALRRVSGIATLALQGRLTADNVDLVVRRLRKLCDRIDALKYPEGEV